jgi:hypothetical protein
MNKTFFFALLITTPLVFLSGCGDQATQAKLEVTLSYATTPNFDGGLIISGRNIRTGEIFSHGIKLGKSLKQPLSLGDWEFTAVGWDGTTGAFTGTPYCAVTKSKIDGTSTSVDINLMVKNATCSDPAFVGTFGAATTSPNVEFQPLNVIPCKSFFTKVPKPTDPIGSAVINEGTPETFCSSASVTKPFPQEWVTKNMSYKISSLNNALESNCLEGTSLKLPSHSVPIRIQFFETVECTNPKHNFVFTNGFGVETAGFDSVANVNATGLRLFLPTNETRRGYTAFAHILPFLEPSGRQFKTQVSGLTHDYYLPPGQPKKISWPGGTCPTFPGSGGNIPPTVTCDDISKLLTITSNSTTTSGTYNIGVYSFYVPLISAA